MYTFNQSEVRITDLEGTEVTVLDTGYNYNDQEERWEKGESEWAEVELVCTAYGGRPKPTIRWTVEGRPDMDLHDIDKFG